MRTGFVDLAPSSGGGPGAPGAIRNLGVNATDGIDWGQWYGEFRGQVCKRTSYNTYGGQHNSGGTAFRKNYAGIGYTYDEVRDAFIPPNPSETAVLDEDTCLWIEETTE